PDVVPVRVPAPAAGVHGTACGHGVFGGRAVFAARGLGAGPWSSAGRVPFSAWGGLAGLSARGPSARRGPAVGGGPFTGLGLPVGRVDRGYRTGTSWAGTVFRARRCGLLAVGVLAVRRLRRLPCTGVVSAD